MLPCQGLTVAGRGGLSRLEFAGGSPVLEAPFARPPCNDSHRFTLDSDGSEGTDQENEVVAYRERVALT